MTADTRRSRIRFCEHCGNDCPWRERTCPLCHLVVGQPIQHHFDVIHAVTGDNADGSSRQALLLKLEGRRFRGRGLELTTEPGRPNDPKAVAVGCESGQLGYLGREVGAGVTDTIRAGCCAMAVLLGVKDIEPVAWPERTVGADILVLQFAPSATADDLKRYIKGVLSQG